MESDNVPNNRVTTREFYDRLETVEQRLIMRLDNIDDSVKQNCILLEGMRHDIEDHESRLDSHASKIDKIQDGTRLANIIAVVGSTIASILGLSR